MTTLTEIIGVIIPMITIAGSAATYVFKAFRDARQKRQSDFFNLMALIDTQGTIAGKMAAIYQFRNFPEHKDFIIRFCEQQSQNLSGNEEAVRILASEFMNTRNFFTK